MMSSGEELDTNMGSGHSNRRRRLFMYGGIGTVVLVIVIVVAVVVSGGGGGGGDGGSAAPGSDPSTSPGTQVNEAIRQTIENVLLADDVSSAAAWQDGNSYQSKALNWVASNSQGQEDKDEIILQRYALACFYYATNAIDTIYSPTPPGWTDSTDWLSDKPECEWLGVQCSLFQVTGLSLPGNGLTGKIPMEMVLLKGTMLNLDLSENALYMSGNELEVFGKLHKLHTILLDDNYLLTDDGLPASMALNTNLEKLRLSYNLLGGPMQGSVVEKWTKLTHLEIESNFLNGALPAELGNLDKLVYMYMRRNDFTSTLDFMKSGRMNNMFSMWLDDNSISGTIPTQIGELTQLASLSITNSSLIGTIPTEFGLLTGLRRVWLYLNNLSGTVPTELAALNILEVFEVQNNNLFGSMPQPVCSHVRNSGYEHKSLVADCQEVTCSGCCTSCA